jgi:hypothetical protein
MDSVAFPAQSVTRPVYPPLRRLREAVDVEGVAFITGEVNRKGGTDDGTTFPKTIRLVHGQPTVTSDRGLGNSGAQQ